MIHVVFFPLIFHFLRLFKNPLHLWSSTLLSSSLSLSLFKINVSLEFSISDTKLDASFVTLSLKTKCHNPRFALIHPMFSSGLNGKELLLLLNYPEKSFESWKNTVSLCQMRYRCTSEVRAMVKTEQLVPCMFCFRWCFWTTRLLETGRFVANFSITRNMLLLLASVSRSAFHIEECSRGRC